MVAGSQRGPARPRRPRQSSHASVSSDPTFGCYRAIPSKGSEGKRRRQTVRKERLAAGSQMASEEGVSFRSDQGATGRGGRSRSDLDAEPGGRGAGRARGREGAGSTRRREGAPGGALPRPYLCFSPSSSSSSLSCLAFGSPSSLSCKRREKTACSDERSYYQSRLPRQQMRNGPSREPAALARTSLAFQPLSGHAPAATDRHDAEASPLTPRPLGKIQTAMTPAPAQAQGGLEH